jgi:hypothetical protein
LCEYDVVYKDGRREDLLPAHRYMYTYNHRTILLQVMYCRAAVSAAAIACTVEVPAEATACTPCCLLHEVWLRITLQLARLCRVRSALNQLASCLHTAAAMWCALALCYRLRDYHLSVFWRLLRPEFVRERGTTLLGITTTSSSTTDSSTIATTNAALITAGSTSTTSSSTATTAKTAPVTPAEVTVGDTSAVKESDITLDVADKFKVMNLPQCYI